MYLKLVRHTFNSNYTIGKLYIDESYFCDTLEDTYRDLNNNIKIMHKTAIPFGVYNIVYNYSTRFKRNMYRLVDVPHFTGILIHAGNTEADTSGCILLGQNRIVGKLINSNLTNNLFNTKVKGCELQISII